MPLRFGRTSLHLVLALALLSSTAAAAEAPAGLHTLTTPGEETSFRADVTGESRLDVSLIEGDIRVESTTGTEVEVTARRSGTGTAPIQVLWLPGSRSVVACTSYRPSGGAAATESDCALGRERDIQGPANAARVDFTVQLPRGVSLRARTVNGDVLVEDFSGPVAAHSVTGRVVVRRGSGVVEARSVSGDVEIDDLVSPRLEVETMSGVIDWNGVARAGDDLRLTSYSGQIRLAPEAGSDGTLDVTTGTGRLTTSLPVERLGDDDEGSRRHRLVLGAGKGSLRVVSHSGNVVVNPTSG